MNEAAPARQLAFPRPLAAALPCALGGCDGALSALQPAGPGAAAIAELWWAMLIGAFAIFVLVIVLLALSFWRRPSAEPDGAARAPHSAVRAPHSAVRERVWLVGGGLGLPLLVLPALLWYTLAIGERLLPKPRADLLTVHAHAEQWQWTFRQPGKRASIVRAGTLDIPAGRPVDVRLTSADVIHSFWVPRLAGKLDVIPGRVNTLRIEGAQPGVYAGQCAEYCGTGHARMHFRVVVHDAASWAAFARQDGEGAP